VCGAVGAAAGWGQPQPPASSPISYYKKKIKVYKGSSAMPQSTKKLCGAALLRLSQITLEKHRQNLVRANFAASKNKKLKGQKLV